MGNTNLTIINKRWPELYQQLSTINLPADYLLLDSTPQTSLVVGDLQISSAYDRQREAELQSETVSANVKQLFVYGIGVGDLPRQMLKRCSHAQITIPILNRSLYKLIFEHFDCADWLADERIELQLVDSQTEIKSPFVSSPATLRLPDEFSSKLCDRVLLELNSLMPTKKQQQDREWWKKQIKANRKWIERDADVARLFNALEGRSVEVAAAGPSLEEHFSRLINGNKPLIAVNTALIPLLKQGITPDYVVVIDAHPDKIWPYFDFDLTLLSKTPLIYYPVIDQRILRAWPGPRFCAYSYSPVYGSINKKLPKGRLFTAGSVLHTATDLAVKLGASEVTLLGADLSYSADKVHVEGSRANDAELLSSTQNRTLINGLGEKVLTSSSFYGFLLDLENYIKSQPQTQFYNGSRRGLPITGADYFAR